ncbi:MAG TPA: CDP-alcohol phosphatidyltransferase family protein [Ruminococcus sp.]|nr:CDP-alcohol phosphatidyltransferase family protein [Ruminococcus sp.]
MAEHYTNPVKKLIPSKLETGYQQLMYKLLGKHIPKNATPNQVTAVGALGGLFAIICALLANIDPLFFIGTIFGLFVHMTADVLDGYVARTRGMSSRAGAYFDLFTDVLISTFLILAFGLTPYAHLAPAAFAAPLYGVMNVTMMNYIIYFNEFQFPRLGPIEAHIAYSVFCILAMVFKTTTLFTFFGIGIMIGDLLMIAAMLPMYYEMVRMAITLFRRLKELEK